MEAVAGIEAQIAETEPAEPITVGRATRLYLPIAASWTMFMLEGNIIVAAISRMSQPKVNEAAFSVIMALTQWMEAPVVDLLTTSTTFAKSRARIAEIKNFALWMMALVLALHFLVVFTPLYFVVCSKWLGIKDAYIAPARIGLMAMLPWAAFIGWRRYCQGILIRNAQTKFVGLGTAVRLAVLAATVFGLSKFTQLSGPALTGIAMTASVGSETLFVHVVSRLKRNAALAEGDDESKPLGYKRLVAFYAPLAAATMLFQLQNFFQDAATARMPNSDQTIPALGVGLPAFFLVIGFTLGLPEMVIALYRDSASAKVLKTFCWGVGAFGMFLVIFLWVTGLDRLYMLRAMSSPEDVVPMARIAFIAGAPLPLLIAAESYFRGLLTAHHMTVSRFAGVAAFTVAIAGTLWLGVRVQGNSMVWVQEAVNVAFLADILVLLWAWRRGSRRGALVSVS